MTDRELLELAAKAAGEKIEYWTEDSSGDVPVAVLSDGDFWQPLYLNTHTYCMGDALRLAVRLAMSVDISEHEESTYAYAGNVPRVYAMELWRGNRDAATCRAIVRAAAEIGKNMQEQSK